jgi:uncharacterized protein (DUF608 family)
MSEDKEAKIIQFPNRKEELKTTKEKVEDLEKAREYYEEIAYAAMDDITNTLARRGYHPLKDLTLVKDMGVLMNLIVAMMYRVDEKQHFLQEPMDEIHQVIKYVKEINDKKREEVFPTEDE